MEFWPQARSLALTSRYLRHGSQHHDREQILIECCFRTRISFPHVRNQNSLGPTAFRVGRRASLSLGGDRMDCLAPGLPATARAGLVRDRELAGLSAARLLHLVVQIRRLYAQFPNTIRSSGRSRCPARLVRAVVRAGAEAFLLWPRY